ncbi:MAG: hypothetical protein R6X27_02975 [Candidatus Desulfacyla sp.]
MKKRLRKKKHLGEFAEWGRQIVIFRYRYTSFLCVTVRTQRIWLDVSNS